MINNKTKNVVLAKKVVVANSPLKRMIGLLGRKSLDAQEALIIKPCNAIHTFFMRFPIDIIFLSKNNEVVKVISDIPPFRLSPICFKSNFVIELPAGTILSSKTSLGDKIDIE